MAATRRRSKRELHVVVTESDGTVTSLLVARGGFNQIRKNPITGLGQVVTTGDNAERADQRTPQVIWTDQQGGMGEFRYTETEGLSSFTDSGCDVRFPGLICLPPAATSLGATGVATGGSSGIYFVQYLHLADCYVIAWSYLNSAATSARRYDDTGGTWNTITTGGTGISNLTGFAYHNGRYCFATSNGAQGLYTSTDGVTWANSAKAKACLGICTHDNKVYVFNSTDSTLDWATDPTVAHASWVSSSALYLHPGETVRQLVEWRDRVGRAVVFLLTTRRILQYDEDADAFLNYFDLALLVETEAGFLPRLLPSPRTGNLLLSLYRTPTVSPLPDILYEFSGAVGILGPNLRGGLVLSGMVSFLFASGATNWTYLFGEQRAPSSTARVLALNEQGGFSAIYDGTDVNGGGYGDGKLFVMEGTTCYEIAVPDNRDTPLQTLRSYLVNTTVYHEFAYTDGGTPNMGKQALWVAVQCLKPGGVLTPGLPTQGSVEVAYKRDVDSAWTTLATLASGNAFPAILPFNSGFGVSFKQIKLRLGLRTTNTSTTPVVTSVALAYVRQEVPRYAYTVPIDLADRAHPLYRGKSVAGLLAAMDRWTQPGALVKLQFAGGDANTPPSTSTTIQNCTFAYSGAEDAERGAGIYQALFSDFSPPASG